MINQIILGLGASLLLGAATGYGQPVHYSGTGLIQQVLSPALIVPLANGQVLIRGSIQIVRAECTDPRVTGRRTVVTDGYVQADGSILLYGRGYYEVGRWDATGNTFTPSGGVWEVERHGIMQTNYSFQFTHTGYGLGGSIDGLRLEQTETRGPASGPNDLTVPTSYTGVIQPPPINTKQIVADFTKPFRGYLVGSGTAFSSNGFFYAKGNFYSPTRGALDSFLQAKFTDQSWTIRDRMTREWRVDLVNLSDNATNSAIIALGGASAPGYSFVVNQRHATLIKWSSQVRDSVLWCEETQLPLPLSGLVLALAVTRANTDLVVTARLLDKANSNTVLLAKSVIDTPNSDPTLDRSQFRAMTGIDFQDLVPDAIEPPPSSFHVYLGVSQITDGMQPTPTATFANLEMFTDEVPPLSVSRAVQLTWPAPGAINYKIQSAPTVQGPWRTVPQNVMPALRQMTLPWRGTNQFFRLIQAP